jgi:hypothetical protein
VNRFRGEESVQLTWVDARALSAPPVEVREEPAIAVHDYRHLAGRPLAEIHAAIEAWISSVGQEDGTLVWGEGLPSPDRVPLCDRHALRDSRCLVLWTSPPSPDELLAALEEVSPQEVVLLCIDPGLDVPRAFLRRLSGLVKYALREYGGQTRLSTLAAAMAHTRWAVHLGLQWMAARGQISMTDEGDRILLASIRARADDDATARLEGQLAAQLEETAAYRGYVRAADPGRLVNSA